MSTDTFALTPAAASARLAFPVGCPVRLADGRSGVVSQPARDSWQFQGAAGPYHFRHLGIDVAVVVEGCSCDVWFGLDQLYPAPA